MAYNPVNPNGQSTMANSAPVVIASDQSVVPVASAVDTSTIYNGSSTLTPKFVAIASGSATINTTILAAVTGKKIRVLSYVMISDGTSQGAFASNAATAISGLIGLVPTSGVTGTYTPNGHFETLVGESLNFITSGAIVINGHLTYVEV